MLYKQPSNGPQTVRLNIKIYEIHYIYRKLMG